VTGYLGILVLHNICLFLLLAAAWAIAHKEHHMAVDVAAVQAKLTELGDQLTTLGETVEGISQDYTTMRARVEALEAALAASDPVAAQAAVDQIKGQLDILSTRLRDSGMALKALDDSEPAPPSPQV
jgi:hypothetical protein